MRTTFVREITIMSSLKWLVSLFIFDVADTAIAIVELEYNIFLKIFEFNLDVESFYNKIELFSIFLLIMLFLLLLLKAFLHIYNKNVKTIKNKKIS